MNYFLSISRKVTVMDYQPDEIAKQMTILDNELFQKVDVRIHFGLKYFAVINVHMTYF